MKEIDWNDLSINTKLILPKDVKITKTSENGYDVILIEPNRQVMNHFRPGDIVKCLKTGDISENLGHFDTPYFILATKDEASDYLFRNNQMYDENGKIVRWKPKNDQIYFVPCFSKERSVLEMTWENDVTDKYWFERNLVFSTQELAENAYEKMLNSLK